MTEKELKKLVSTQEQLAKLRSQIADLVRMHNTLIPEIQRLATDVTFGTQYTVDDIPYVRDERLFSIAVEEQPFHRTAIGLKALHRKPRQVEPEAQPEPKPAPAKRTTRRAPSSSKTNRQEHSES